MSKGYWFEPVVIVLTANVLGDESIPEFSWIPWYIWCKCKDNKWTQQVLATYYHAKTLWETSGSRYNHRLTKCKCPKFSFVTDDPCVRVNSHLFSLMRRLISLIFLLSVRLWTVSSPKDPSICTTSSEFS